MTFFLLYTLTCVGGVCPVNPPCCSSIVDHRRGRLSPDTSARWANKHVTFVLWMQHWSNINNKATVSIKEEKSSCWNRRNGLTLKAASCVPELAASLSCFRFFIKQLDQWPNMAQTRMQTLFVLVYECLSHPLLPSVSRRVCKLPLSGFNLHFSGHGRTTSYPSPSCALVQGLAAEPSLDLLLLDDVCFSSPRPISVCLSL